MMKRDELNHNTIIKNLQSIRNGMCNSTDIPWIIDESIEFIKSNILNQDTQSHGNWIKCSEQMPPEHDSIFAKFKGTDKWNIGMFEKCSDYVNVTVEFEDGSRNTETRCTHDGKWDCIKDTVVKRKVIAWKPLPEEYKGAE